MVFQRYVLKFKNLKLFREQNKCHFHVCLTRVFIYNAFSLKVIARLTLVHLSPPPPLGGGVPVLGTGRNTHAVRHISVSQLEFRKLAAVRQRQQVVKFCF